MGEGEWRRLKYVHAKILSWCQVIYVKGNRESTNVRRVLCLPIICLKAEHIVCLEEGSPYSRKKRMSLKTRHWNQGDFVYTDFTRVAYILLVSTRISYPSPCNLPSFEAHVSSSIIKGHTHPKVCLSFNFILWTVIHISIDKIVCSLCC